VDEKGQKVGRENNGLCTGEGGRMKRVRIGIRE
jgi:hypothetical protein